MKPTGRLPRGTPSGPGTAIVAIVIVAVCAAYWNSLSGPFIIDDQIAIVGNPQIRALSSAALFPERELPTAGRPLVNVSLALNYALGGLDVRGYHAFNIAVHLLCALLLFGLVRRTLELPSARVAFHSPPVAVAVAISLLWAIHPLNTEVVDYLTQRTESLMAGFYLLTLYAVARAAQIDPGTRWRTLAITACAAGMACKESMVTAPVAVVLFERAFVFDSFAASFRERWKFYAGLALTWGWLAILIWSGPRIHSAGFATGVSSWAYLLNQSVVITDYLRLAIWPLSLAVNWGWSQPTTLAAVWPHIFFIGVLVTLALVAVVRYPKVGVLAAWFFIALAPTSSILPIATEVGAERRMYLPLIALIVLAVVALSRYRRLDGPTGAAVVGVVALALTWGTVTRNREYASPIVLAQTNLERRPTSDAHHWLGVELIVAGRDEEGLVHLRQAVPGAPRAHYTLGYELLKRGDVAGAISELEAFVRDQPFLLEAVSARSLLGRAYASQRRWTEAITQHRTVLTMNPSRSDRTATERLLGDALMAQESYADAAAHFNAALMLSPNDVDAIMGLGLGAVATDHLDRAAALFERALSIAPNSSAAHRNLAAVRFDQRNAEAAAPHAQRAVQLSPDDPVAHDILGRVLTVQGRVGEARAAFERALQIDADYAQAREDLARLQAAMGDR